MQKIELCDVSVSCDVVLTGVGAVLEEASLLVFLYPSVQVWVLRVMKETF